jgi:FAD binding domain
VQHEPKERPIVLRATTTLDDLKEELTGGLVLPGDPDWDAARAAWLLDVDQRPAAVASPATAADMARVVAAARGLGLRVAAQTTGHHASALGPLQDTVLLKTSRLTGVRIDAAARTARVASGAVWLDVSRPASAAGLAGLAGSSPDVGVAGYTLGGGLGWLARRHGLAANSVTAIELVTADGRQRRVGHRHDPELFWALRGGGGRFGVVTALEFRLYPVPELYAGWLAWPWERAREVLQAWREWLPSLPDEVTSIGRLLQVPPFPHLPEAFRGRQLVAVEAAMLRDQDAGAALLRPLCALRPEIDTVAAVPPLALSHLHMDPEGPVPAGVGQHRLLAELPAAAVDALVEAAALEGLAEALYLEREYSASAAHYERAYSVYRRERQNVAAGRAARTLAWITGNVLGHWAVRSGWLARARTILEEAGQAPGPGKVTRSPASSRCWPAWTSPG